MSKEYRIEIGSEAMDVDAIHSFLSGAYWSEGIPIETLKIAVENSVCVGVFHLDKQVGFARATTDRATFAYIADVYVLEQHRGNGLSKSLLDSLFSHQDLQGLRRMMLATRDAHDIYKAYGFTELARPEIIMENWRPDVYTDA